MKKGFTLIEMLAVLIVIGLIAFVVLPSITTQLKEKENEISNNSLEIIYDAVDRYMDNYPSNYPTVYSNTYCIKLEQLTKEDYLQKPLKDIKTGNMIPLDKVIKINVNQFGDKEYKLLEDTETCENFLKEIVAERIYIVGNNYVKIGGTTKLKVLFTPEEVTDQTITWTSSNEDVATIDEGGLVSGIKQGKTTITALTTNGKKAQIEVEVRYVEEILNGADPVLKENLIPVTLSNSGVVTYANIGNKWYNYENKEWANAVILKDSPSKVYNVGDTILESDIESYFVWIPKYSYKLWDLGNYDSITEINEEKVHSIDIIFGTKNTSDDNENECTTPLLSGSNGNCEVGDYMTHPSFITLGTKGLWVGKFETTGTTSQLTVKPNSVSLKNQTVSSMFNLALNYETSMKSHMMKNTEWGAVAYLHHSRYGSSTELMINNNSNYLTGYARVEAPTCGYTGDNRDCNKYGTTSDITVAYNTTIGYKASTTGNITGIYDMAGGAHEYMASYIEGYLGSSGLSQDTIDTNLKYFDIYSSSSDTTTYNYRILGDATGELGPFGINKVISTSDYYQGSWYGDLSYFVDSSSSWFSHGGTYGHGTGAGSFSFARGTGANHGSFGFRLVLAP